MMNLTRSQIIIIGVVVLLIIGVIVVFVVGRQDGVGGRLSGKINFWGVEDSSQVMRELIDKYKAMRPGVEINYLEINKETYETDLINALAGANGPDLFMIHNTWLPKHFDKITPLLSESFTIKNLQSLFPTVVEQDFAPDGIIYALPLYLDTLALFYNKDFFDEKGIALPPKNWEEFQSFIPRLRELDRSGKITKAAAAIGGSNRSIENATDILNLLLLQTGTKMTSDDFSRATFSTDGQQALKFYTDFANLSSPYFTWNENLPYSSDYFSQGGAAMMFGYARQIPLIKQKNPFLRFSVLPMLQPKESSKPINYANYWGVAASVKSKNSALAWDFAIYLSTNLDAQRKYAELTAKPPALRTLINQTLNDPVIGIFSRQSLTARSWPQVDGSAVKNTFSSMIENVLTGRLSVDRAINEAESKITQLMQRRR